VSYSKQAVEAALTLLKEAGDHTTTYVFNGTSAVIVISDPRLQVKIDAIVEALIESVLDEEDTPYLVIPTEKIDS
jgi:hypothetical protein